MAKDKRSKGCPNAECARNQKKYHYKVTDQYCTICGSELVLVCQDCFQKLADLGPKHIRCNSCAAEREDRKHRPEKRIKHIAGEATDFAKDAAKQTKEIGAGLLDGAKELAQQTREIIKKERDEHTSKKWYGIIANLAEDETVIIVDSIRLLQEAGFTATTHVAGGTVFGYVLTEKENLDKVEHLLEPKGVSVSQTPLDRSLAKTFFGREKGQAK